MKNFLATTESGTTYRYEGFLVHIDSPRHGKTTMRLMRAKAVDRTELEKEHFWEGILASPDVDIPEVGKSLYIDNIDAWRLSTKIASVEELPYSED